MGAANGSQTSSGCIQSVGFPCVGIEGRLVEEHVCTSTSPKVLASAAPTAPRLVLMGATASVPLDVSRTEVSPGGSSCHHKPFEGHWCSQSTLCSCSRMLATGQFRSHRVYWTHSSGGCKPKSLVQIPGKCLCATSSHGKG